eukprot:966859-Prorocentrum_minimum.AAC.1
MITANAGLFLRGNDIFQIKFTRCTLTNRLCGCGCGCDYVQIWVGFGASLKPTRSIPVVINIAPFFCTGPPAPVTARVRATPRIRGYIIDAVVRFLCHGASR